MNRKKMIEKYNILFLEQEEYIKSLLLEGEHYKHCLDSTSFCGRFFNYNWVVCSGGRIFSLNTKKFIVAKLNEYDSNKSNGRYKVDNSVTDTMNTVHGIVANYFCDKSVVKEFGEFNVEVHHIRQFDTNKTCEYNNNINNIQYVESEMHKKKISQIQRGTYKWNDMTGNNVQFMANQMPHNKKNQIKVYNDDNGKQITEMTIFPTKYFCNDILEEIILIHSQEEPYAQIENIRKVYWDKDNNVKYIRYKNGRVFKYDELNYIYKEVTKLPND